MNGRGSKRTSAEWVAYLEAAQREGVTLAAYARQHGLSTKQLYRARQHLRRVEESSTRIALSERAKSVPAKTFGPFAQVRVTAAPSLPIPSKLVAQLPNGVTVELECGADDVLLVSAVVSTLGQCHVPVRR